MIELTRLNGNKFSINCDVIKYIEATPDTTLTLTTGEKILAAESCAVVVQLALEDRAQVLRLAWPDALTFLSGKSSEGLEARSAGHVVSFAGANSEGPATHRSNS